MAVRKKPAAQTMQDMVLKALEAAGGFSYLNSSSPVNATTWAGTYRLGMGYSDSATAQAIQLYGGTLTSVTNKTADTTGVTNLYIFRAQNTYLARTLSMALIGRGVGWDAQKVEATLAALNLARNGLRAL